jgi:exosortase
MASAAEIHPTLQARRPGARGFLIGAAFVLALVLCLPALRGLSILWERIEFYGHASLLPLVSLYLVVGNRRQIRRALRDLRPPAFGSLVVLAAGAFEVLMVMGDIRFLAGLGVPLTLGATAYAVGGMAFLRPLLLPLLFLMLMVPPPGMLVEATLFRLKLLVTDAAVWVLHQAAVPVLANGNQIQIPGATLFVADACSGLTSIVTMLPLGCIVACFLSHGVWRRVVVVGSIVPLAMLANVARVVVTVQLASHIGAEAAQGALHESFGVATYVIGLVFLVAIARVLR